MQSHSCFSQPKRDDGWAFVVTLTRIVRTKNGQERQSVRMEPHPPYICKSALEARHWGATYALYRVRLLLSLYSIFEPVKPIVSFYQFCNGIQLNRVLPPGPRDYWVDLAAEHKKAPSHQSWMYDADPFAARKSVADRQEKAAKKKDTQETAKTPAFESKSDLFNDSPEVKLSSELRGLVENAIKMVFIFNGRHCIHHSRLC
jgi:ATP-dependent RNA helicase DHX57